MLSTGSSKRSGIELASPAHAFFAATLIALGAMMLVKGGFSSPWSGVPKTLPARPAAVYACGLLVLGSGVGLFWRSATAAAARVLLGLFVIWMLLFRLPQLVATPTSSGAWWAVGEIAVMIAAPWMLLVRFAGDGAGLVTGAAGLRVARVLYGFGLAMFGVAHFTFLERTVSMVPGWLPWHLGWAYFTGGALVAAGLGIALGVLAPLAALLAALELTLFTILVWGPVILKGANAGDWNEFVDSWALTAAAWVVADSLRGTGRDAQVSRP